MMFLVVAGCDTGEAREPVDSADVCDEWEEFVRHTVASEATICPNASEIDLNQVGRWQGCDGDEVVVIVERVSESPTACSYLLTCDWSCNYRARVRNCAAAPTSCWII